MVDLPQVRNDVPQVRPPNSPVSPGQIAQPYAQVSSLLESASKEAEAVAKPLAREAGIQAVTRDADGNMQVERLPIVGPAAKDFSDAVKWSAFAQSAGEARRADLVLARKYQYDPDGYLRAADAFRKDYVQKITKVAGPEVGVELSRAIDGITTQQFNSILAQQQAKIRRDFDHDTAAMITNDTVDLQNLIKTGGLDTPAGKQEFVRLTNRIANTYHQRSANPILGAPPGETALKLKQFDQQVGASLFASGIRKILNDPDGGIEKAQAAIDANFDDQSVPATQRVENRAVALDTIKEITQDRVRSANMAVQQQKQYDEAFEQRVIGSTTLGAERMTLDQIKKDPYASAAAKMKMENYVKREGMPEPLARTSNERAIGLIRQIRSGEMGTNGKIYDAYDAGELNKADFNFVNGEFEKLRGPGGEKLGQAKKSFFDAVKTSITKSNPLLGTLDKSGDLQLYRFEQDVAAKMDEYRNTTGKDPYDLLNPNKPDFMGTSAALQQYQVPIEQSMRNIANQFRRPPPPPAVALPPSTQPAGAVPPKARETPDQVLKRLGL